MLYPYVSNHKTPISHGKGFSYLLAPHPVWCTATALPLGAMGAGVERAKRLCPRKYRNNIFTMARA